MKALPTTTTVAFEQDLPRDRIQIDGKTPSQHEQDRAIVVIESLRRLSGSKSLKARVQSKNPGVRGKGLGFSASGFAALGLATARALGLNIETRELSEIVRKGAGSASRSLTGAFSIWYANKEGRSYAEQIASANSINLKTIIIPIESEIKTDRAHGDVITSPFFRPRLKYLQSILPRMRRAISRKDVKAIGRLAEEDTLNLHAVTMTGKEGLILFSPVSIKIIREVRRLREEEDVPAWFSLDTGPSVFVNTTPDAAPIVRRRLSGIAKTVLVSDPGGPAGIINKHLF
jgi:phosphomevalonate decarboxylase